MPSAPFLPDQFLKLVSFGLFDVVAIFIYSYSLTSPGFALLVFKKLFVFSFGVTRNDVLTLSVFSPRGLLTGDFSLIVAWALGSEYYPGPISFFSLEKGRKLRYLPCVVVYSAHTLRQQLRASKGNESAEKENTKSRGRKKKNNLSKHESNFQVIKVNTSW